MAHGRLRYAVILGWLLTAPRVWAGSEHVVMFEPNEPMPSIAQYGCPTMMTNAYECGVGTTAGFDIQGFDQPNSPHTSYGATPINLDNLIQWVLPAGPGTWGTVNTSLFRTCLWYSTWDPRGSGVLNLAAIDAGPYNGGYNGFTIGATVSPFSSGARTDAIDVTTFVNGWVNDSHAGLLGITSTGSPQIFASALYCVTIDAPIVATPTATVTVTPTATMRPTETPFSCPGGPG